MKRLNIIVLFGLLFDIAPSLRSQEQLHQEPLIRTRVDVVSVLCTVREDGGKGRYVEGLTKEAFEVYEDGVRQNLQYFNHSIGEDGDPLSVALLIDTSGSVESKLSFEQEAAVDFLKSTIRKNKDLAAIVQFDSEIELLQDFTFDLPLLERAVMSTEAAGYTKLYDAIFLAADDLLRNEVGRRVIVVLSDGCDTLSVVSKQDAIKAAQEQDIVIFGLGIKGADTNYEALKDFAKDTGGLFVDSKIDLTRLREAFAKIDGEIKHQYSLAYVSNNEERDGEFRKIKIKLKEVKKRGLRIKHRKGYYAPQAESLRAARGE